MKRITFTGVDEETKLPSLMARAGVGIEFAVLVGSRTGRAPRYPCRPFVFRFRDFCAEHGINSAIHLCGSYARGLLSNEIAVLDLCRGFGRVQFNAREGEYQYAQLRERSQRLGIAIIVQHRMGFDPGTLPCRDLEYLADRSGGRGISDLGLWSAPRGEWLAVRCGYAGGIGPCNIVQAMDKVCSFGTGMSRGSWIDMESGVRTNDLFDLEKVDQVLEERIRFIDGRSV